MGTVSPTLAAATAFFSLSDNTWLVVGLESHLLPYIPRLLNSAHAILYHCICRPLFFSRNCLNTIFIIIMKYKCWLHPVLILIVFAAHEGIVRIPSYTMSYLISFGIQMLV